MSLSLQIKQDTFECWERSVSEGGKFPAVLRSWGAEQYQFVWQTLSLEICTFLYTLRWTGTWAWLLHSIPWTGMGGVLLCNWVQGMCWRTGTQMGQMRCHRCREQDGKDSDSQSWRPNAPAIPSLVTPLGVYHLWHSLYLPALWTVKAVNTSTCYLLLSTKVFMCNLTPPLPYHLLSSKNSHGLSKLALAVFYGGYATAENPVKTCSTNFRGSVLMSYQIPRVAIFLLVWDSTTAANPKPNPIPTLVTLTITQQVSLHF